MNLVRIDADGTCGLSLIDIRGSRVIVARCTTGAHRWLQYTGMRREATVYRDQDVWRINLWDVLWFDRRSNTLLHLALAIARQHVGLPDCTASLRRAAP